MRICTVCHPCHLRNKGISKPPSAAAYHRISSGLVIIVVNERLDDKGGSPGIVGDLLMGDPDVVKVFESLRSLAQGETKIYMESQTEPHDMGVMPAELQGRSIFRKGV